MLKLEYLPLQYFDPINLSVEYKNSKNEKSDYFVFQVTSYVMHNWENKDDLFIDPQLSIPALRRSYSTYGLSNFNPRSSHAKTIISYLKENPNLLTLEQIREVLKYLPKDDPVSMFLIEMLSNQRFSKL